MKKYILILLSMIIPCIIFIIKCDDSDEISYTHLSDECPVYNEQRCSDGIIQKCSAYDDKTDSFITDTENLYLKALEYDLYARENHLSNGLLVSTTIDSEEYVMGDEHLVSFHGCGDAACWSGHYLFSQAYRYRTNGSPEALENIRTVVDGIYGNFMIAQETGNAGLAARYHALKTETRADANNPDDVGEGGGYRPGLGAWSDYFWNGCISTDQYSGMMLGLSAAWDAVNDTEIKNKIKACVISFVDALMNNDPQFMIKLAVPDGATGRSFHTKIGNDWYLDYNINNNEFNINRYCGIYLCSFFLMAYKMTGDQNYLNFYNNVLIGQENAIADMKAWNCIYGVDCFPNYNHYYNNNITFIAMFNLVDNERYNDTLLTEYKSIITDIFWERLKDDKNAWFACLFSGAVNGDEFADEIVNTQLNLFPKGPRRKISIVMTDEDSRIERDNDGNVLPLDINLRSISDFQWQRDPNGYLTNEANNDPYREEPGADYIAVYWFSRYKGIISSDAEAHLKWQNTEDECSY